MCVCMCTYACAGVCVRVSTYMNNPALMHTHGTQTPETDGLSICWFDLKINLTFNPELYQTQAETHIMGQFLGEPQASFKNKKHVLLFIDHNLDPTLSYIPDPRLA